MSAYLRICSQKSGLLGFITLVTMMVFCGTGCSPAGGNGEPVRGQRTLDIKTALAGTNPLFVSDYFSFAGEDEKGKVAFAIDNDRSRRGKAFTADAHVVLYGEHEGWIDVSGAGEYENKGRDLIRIPDSPYVQFTGDVKNGISLSSPRNRLQLTVAPMIERVSRTGRESLYSMGSTSATLAWRDRVIPGRVIYEYLFIEDLSPWYSVLSGLFYNDFQGLYLKMRQGDDFYLHTSKGEAWSQVTAQVLGFQVIGGRSEVLHDLSIAVPERSFGFGFYRWPNAWRISWQGSEGAGTLSLRVVSRRTVTNWLIGGFAMAFVSGDIVYGGKSRSVYGLAELIR